MNVGFGPFSVEPAQVGGLSGALFQELINRLLDVEVASAGSSGVGLHTSYRENVGDKGVDAALYSAIATEWVPAGDSAWQFKAGDLGPESCAVELEKAKRVQEILRNGGKYRLVLGKSMEDYLIDRREEALRNKAKELGFDVSGDTFKIIAGGRLATWVERHPQLAVSRLLNGVGHVAVGFDTWQRSGHHQTTWVPSDDRVELCTTVQEFLSDNARLELRVEGVSGLGKTRGVLEALRGSTYEALVLYVGDADVLTYPLINHLTMQQRTAVVVIDECTRQRHKVFAEQLEQERAVKLITIGERDGRVTQSVPRQIGPLPNEVIEAVLTTSRRSLWPEARRVVVANCAGNVRWALHIAEMIIQNPDISIGDLIDADTLQVLLGNLLKVDDNSLAISALALFTRYGVDQEIQAELQLIAMGLHIPLEQLEAANRRLEKLGLITRHGRYRSVTPQPLAVYLARQAWQDLGEHILSSLLPTIDPSLAERLFLRAADLGSSSAAAGALNKILGRHGPFRSLEALTEKNTSRLLVQLAIVCPEEVAGHLSGLIDKTADVSLSNLKPIRRDLVWTLEKLIWHSSTFELAADALLRLALTENETWSNNATGTWVSLFGTMLPTTAARPDDRMTYLERVATDPDPAVRHVAAKAADHALDATSTVVVSGELQGGVIVEPRGTPTTYNEAWAYFRAAIILLRRLAEDSDDAVRATALAALIGAIHPFLEHEAVRDTLFDALADLPPEALRKVRTEIKHLHALLGNVEKPGFIVLTNSAPDVDGQRAGLDLLNGRLPEPTSRDELTALAFASRWEWEDNTLQKEIIRHGQAMPTSMASELLQTLLAGADAPEASLELGAALHTVDAGPETEAVLATIADRGNPQGLIGYLLTAIHDGDADAFDLFLDGNIGHGLEPATRLLVTVRGPTSGAGWTRVMDLLKVLPVHISAPQMFGWRVHVDDVRLGAILDEWLSKITSQRDYNFAVDTVAMMVWQRPLLTPTNEARIVRLVELREKFREVGQERWDWVQLAKRRVAAGANDLLLMLLAQIDTGVLDVFAGSAEQTLLQDAARAAGADSLDRVLALVQTGSWRLQVELRGWLADLYLPTEIAAWIGEDLQRARLVASLSTVAEEGPPSEIVRYLLDQFGSDNEVASALYGNFLSGIWWGNESERLKRQIEQLDSWLRNRDQSSKFRTWIRDVIASLTERLDIVLLREAEYGR